MIAQALLPPGPAIPARAKRPRGDATGQGSAFHAPARLLQLQNALAAKTRVTTLRKSLV
jgi:hypothetical protein